MKQNFIAGKWVDTAHSVKSINPSNLEETIGIYAQGGKEDVDQAVNAAQKAQKSWAETSIQARSDFLDRVGNVLMERSESIGRMLSRDEGKTLVEGIGETVRAAQIMKYFAGEALRIKGVHLPSVRPGIDVEIHREPVGVIGVITPWNFPIAIPVWKIAPALAYGNSVVFKPAELVPACAWILVDILRECGLPEGVVNLVMGKGSEVGQAMIDHEGIQAVSFTGSVVTGREIAKSCAALGKKVQCEMGGKNPLIVLKDADLKAAVNGAINGAFFSTGQRCTASSRILVEDQIYDSFSEQFIQSMNQLTVGDALDSETKIGPVIDDRQLKIDLDYIALAKQEGCEVIGGAYMEEKNHKKGYYLHPVTFLKAKNQMRIAQEEIFGPCAALLKVSDFEDAIEQANDIKFGLSAGIYTNDLTKARAFKKRSRAGMVMVNQPTAGVDPHAPFGGIKSSSYGAREQGFAAIEFYTNMKTAYIG